MKHLPLPSSQMWKFSVCVCVCVCMCNMCACDRKSVSVCVYLHLCNMKVCVSVCAYTWVVCSARAHVCVCVCVCVYMCTAGWCVLLPDLFVSMGQRVLLDDGLGCTAVDTGAPLQVELHNTTDKVNWQTPLHTALPLSLPLPPPTHTQMLHCSWLDSQHPWEKSAESLRFCTNSVSLCWGYRHSVTVLLTVLHQQWDKSGTHVCKQLLLYS